MWVQSTAADVGILLVLLRSTVRIWRGDPMDPLLTDKNANHSGERLPDTSQRFLKNGNLIHILLSLLKYNIISLVLLLTQRILYYQLMIKNHARQQ